MASQSRVKRPVSRRHLLKTGAAALGGGAAYLVGSPPEAAQNPQAPAVSTGTQTGRPFRGLVRHADTLDVQELRLLPIDPRQVVVRSGRGACYTIIQVRWDQPDPPCGSPDHCGFRVVRR